MTDSISMPSQKPVKNKTRSTAVHYALCLSKSSAAKSTAVICTCMHLLGMPAVLTSAMLYMSSMLKKGTAEHYFDSFDNSIPYIVIGCIAFIIAFLSGSNAAMNSFSHLYSKQKVDMELSLPLSHRQRFVSGFFTGLGTYILPFIAAQILSMIIFLTGHLTLDGKTVPVSGKEQNVTFDTFEALFPYYIKAAAGVLVIMIMFYTMWVLTMTFCGSKLEAVLYGAGANLIMPAVFGSALSIIDCSLYGSSALVYLPLGDTFLGFLISCTSPAGAALALAECLAGEANTSVYLFEYYLPDGSGPSFVSFIVSVLAVSAVFFFAAMFVYSRRKAEDTGKSFAVKGFYYFALTCMIFFAITMTMCNALNVIPVIIASAAVYIILDCICERGVKKMGLSCIKYTLTALVSLGVFFLLSNTGCLGAEYRVPDVSEISSAELVDYRDYFGSSEYFWNYPYNKNNIFKYSDEENIKMITDMHRTHLEYYREHPGLETPLPSWYGRSYSHLSNSILPLADTLVIRYKLKNGFTLTRAYTLYCGAQEKIISLDTSDEAKENYIAGVTAAIDQINEEYDSFYAYISGGYYSTTPNTEYKMPSDFPERIKETLAEDVRNVSYEEYIHPERPSYGELRIMGRSVSGTGEGESLEIELLGHFHKTAEYLRSVGLDPGKINVKGNYESIKTHAICISRFDPSFGCPVGTASLNETVMTFINDDSFLNYNVYSYEDSIGVYVYKHFLDDEDMEALFRICSDSVDNCVPETDCYTIKLPWQRSYCYIPEKYNSTVERICEKYRDKGFIISPETREKKYLTK